MSRHHKWVSLIVALIISATAGQGLAQSIRASNGSPLLFWANKLQQNITAQNTEYRHKDNIVTWGNDAGSTQCYADCSGFINALIARSFEWNDEVFQREFGHKRMYAYHYYEAITSGHRFRQVKSIGDVLPGDIIALQYADRSEHDDNTGHVMLVVSVPRPHRASKVFEPNTNQFEVDVIDCSKSPHGKNDTRFIPGGSEYSGLGRGSFRLYADEQSNIVGYSWSTGNPKEGFNPFENPIAVGRFISGNR